MSTMNIESKAAPRKADQRAIVAAMLRLSAIPKDDWEETIQQILQIEAEVLGLERVSYWSVRDRPSLIHCDMGYIASPRAFERGCVLFESQHQRYFAEISRGGVLVVEDAQNDPRLVDLREYTRTRDITSMMDIPVWARGPNPTGGYQLDARVATLQEQALGALTNHAQIQHALPQRRLDDLASFQRLLFTNHRVRALSDALREGTTPPPDPDPPLSELEEQGKAVFVRACSQCHGGPGMSTPQFPVNRFMNISSGCPRPVDTVTPARFVFAACEPRVLRNARTYEIELSVPTLTPGGLLPAGARVRRRTDDPGRAFLTGFVGGPGPEDDWEKFDVPGLRGISATAPYFHNNSAATLDDVVDHYTQFFKRVLTITPPGVVSPVVSTDGVHVDRPPRPEERAALLAYLRRL